MRVINVNANAAEIKAHKSQHQCSSSLRAVILKVGYAEHILGVRDETTADRPRRVEHMNQTISAANTTFLPPSPSVSPLTHPASHRI
ncbi:unnamed protein product [Timema podura]|uniref:Uncharacterized protein n=1 Tax=Timema podura TaxID=61482 RepID=A0ABN7NVX2_TIMPD|nr:unnamed protein product [Timema podura]